MASLLSEYGFEIKHIKGKENIVVDALSRQKHRMYSILISDYESEFKALLKEASNNDEQYNTWVEKCNKENFETEEVCIGLIHKGFYVSKIEFMCLTNII